MAEHAGLLSKGITLAYGPESTVLTNLMEIPELGNGAKEKIEVTVLTDDAKQYIAGLGDAGQELAFKFLYDKAQFTTLSAMAETQAWTVTLPDSATAKFNGTPSVKMDGAGTNAALTYTLTVTVESDITFA